MQFISSLESMAELEEEGAPRPIKEIALTYLARRDGDRSSPMARSGGLPLILHQVLLLPGNVSVPVGNLNRKRTCQN